MPADRIEVNILTLTRDGETDIVATRRFEVSPEALYRASIRC